MFLAKRVYLICAQSEGDQYDKASSELDRHKWCREQGKIRHLLELANKCNQQVVAPFLSFSFQYFVIMVRKKKKIETIF